jgi:3-phenylpropionate/trans-cinnamate dioxygenase ferredoxin reductase component
MADRSVAHLLVGGGMAAGNCARHLREQGAEGDILLVGREPELPYNRPPLSKQYVRGEESKDEVLFRPASWYEQQRIEALTRTTVTRIDPNERLATLSNGERVKFDKALLATGANVRILHAEGAERDGIHYLRTLHNSDALRAELEQAERVAIIGGSFIGTELAASFTALGKQCELIMLESAPLERFFGPEVGNFFQRVLTEHGVAVHGSQELARFEGSGGRVGRVVTKSGLEIDCDFVVIGVGVHPDIHLAEEAGIETNSGVLTDRCLETSAPGIFAAGDIAEYDSAIHGRRLRIEHWDVAFNQGKTAALNMLGKRQPHDVVPYFWSDLADWSSMEYVGPALEWDEIWWRGSRDAGVFTAWYLKDARLAAALTVGRSDDLEAARRLLTQGVDLTGKRLVLEDPAGDLAALESARAEPHGSLLGTIAQYAGAPKQFVKGRFARRGTELPGPGEGRVVQVDGDKVAAYREKDGELHAVSAVCTHLRCVVEWNGADRTWDCPCHGSRFDYDGRVIKGPAKTDLEQKPVAEPASR